MPKKKAKPAAETDGGDPQRFEEALAELEGIVAEMEEERVPLDDLLKKYERGTRLLRLCQGHIGAARARVEQIADQGEKGQIGLEPFDGQAGATRETAGSSSTLSTDPETTNPDDDIQLL